MKVRVGGVGMEVTTGGGVDMSELDVVLDFLPLG